MDDRCSETIRLVDDETYEQRRIRCDLPSGHHGRHRHDMSDEPTIVAWDADSFSLSTVASSRDWGFIDEEASRG